MKKFKLKISKAVPDSGVGEFKDVTLTLHMKGSKYLIDLVKQSIHETIGRYKGD